MVWIAVCILPAVFCTAELISISRHHGERRRPYGRKSDDAVYALTAAAGIIFAIAALSAFADHSLDLSTDLFAPAAALATISQLDLVRYN